MSSPYTYVYIYIYPAFFLRLYILVLRDIICIFWMQIIIITSIRLFDYINRCSGLRVVAVLLFLLWVHTVSHR